jgi:ribosomal protein S18 acetylase RimI-like enzyme
MCDSYRLFPGPAFQLLQTVRLAMLEDQLLTSQLKFAVTKYDDHKIAPSVNALAISLSPVSSSDASFLYQTYVGTRTEEMALTGWNPEQQESFLRMQYEAQRRSYLLQLPNAEYSVIRRDEIAVGRLIVDRTPEEIHVVDIALLPEFRAQGIGSILMEAIMKEASQAAKRVRLHVERFNPALRWYERLGFGVVSAGPIYLEMVWRPAEISSGHNQPASGPEPDISESSFGETYVDLSD